MIKKDLNKSTLFCHPITKKIWKLFYNSNNKSTLKVFNGHTTLIQLNLVYFFLSHSPLRSTHILHMCVRHWNLIYIFIYVHSYLRHLFLPGNFVFCYAKNDDCCISLFHFWIKFQFNRLHFTHYLNFICLIYAYLYADSIFMLLMYDNRNIFANGHETFFMCCVSMMCKKKKFRANERHWPSFLVCVFIWNSHNLVPCLYV